ncbi:MAG: hypothetical protein A2636_03860 [Elusimicrobia bacterium RIFCSPHIGHO2_01_FULL_64_10]|nr:MAG: hypothetical protein A2636_03860 [Elusimicrobia bacterium RIFCSPHIGHO2_01_FULL_64_10]
MTMIKKFWNELLGFFSDDADPDEPVYDPLHFAGMIVTVVFAIGLLFWLLWTLLVYEGGLFGKIVPALRVLFTDKTLEDFGWVGAPYEMGIFSGYAANLIALALALALVFGIWRLFL